VIRGGSIEVRRFLCEPPQLAHFVVGCMPGLAGQQFIGSRPRCDVFEVMIGQHYLRNLIGEALTLEIEGEAKR